MKLGHLIWVLLLTMSTFGCSVHAPFGLAPSTEPITSDYRRAEAVEAKICRPVLFGLISLKPSYGMTDLIDQAAADADALIGVTIDEHHSWWLIGSTTCHSLRARAVYFVPSTPMSSMISDTVSDDYLVSPGAAVETAEPQMSRQSEIPPAAYRFTEMIYEWMGREKPTKSEEFESDVLMVWSLFQQGHDADSLKRAVYAGMDAVGANKPLPIVLRAGITK